MKTLISMPPRVAAGILPAVAGGILPPGHKSATYVVTLLSQPDHPAGSRAIRQPRMAAATVAAGGIPAGWHPEKRLKNCYIKPWRPHYD